MARIVDIFELLVTKTPQTIQNTTEKIKETIKKYFDENSVLLSKFGFEAILIKLFAKNKEFNRIKRPSRYTRPAGMPKHRKTKSCISQAYYDDLKENSKRVANLDVKFEGKGLIRGKASQSVDNLYGASRVVEEGKKRSLGVGDIGFEKGGEQGSVFKIRNVNFWE